MEAAQITKTFVKFKKTSYETNEGEGGGLKISCAPNNIVKKICHSFNMKLTRLR
jgi:hypothetical protein